MSKVESAAAGVLELNPDVEVETEQGRLNADNALELVGRYDFVVDCTDNFSAKYLINDACVIVGKPFSHAGVLGFGGQAFTWEPPVGNSPCLRCMLPEQPPADETPNCAGSGVLGAAVGVLGSVQAAEAIKSVTGIGERLTGRILSFDCLKMRFSSARFVLDPSCPVCSGNANISTLSAHNYRH